MPFYIFYGPLSILWVPYACDWKKILAGKLRVNRKKHENNENPVFTGGEKKMTAICTIYTTNFVDYLVIFFFVSWCFNLHSHTLSSRIYVIVYHI